MFLEDVPPSRARSNPATRPSSPFIQDAEMDDSASLAVAHHPPAFNAAAAVARWGNGHRPSLSTSAMDFALPITGLSAPPSPSLHGVDEHAKRMRRASLLGLSQPMTSLHRSRSDGDGTDGLASGSASASSMSDIATPADVFYFEPSRSRPSTPSTPPRRRSSMSGAFGDRPALRRVSNPVRYKYSQSPVLPCSHLHHADQARTTTAIPSLRV